MAEREELILEVRTELDRAKADVEALEKQLEELEDRDPIPVELDIDSDADTEALEKKLDDLEEREPIPVEVDTEKATADLEGLDADLLDAKEAAESFGFAFDTTDEKIAAVRGAVVGLAQTIDGELRASQSAADALGNALGPELSAKINLGDKVADFQKMGLTLDEIRGNADQLASALKEVDGIKVTQLRDGIDNSDQAMRRLGASSDQSRSVLANLAGNASQDLGELGGVAGTAGVAIGQLAEYAVDGNIKLSALAGLAVPMLGVAVAAQAVSTAIGGIKTEDAFNAELVNDFSDALREGQTVAQTLRDTIESTGDLNFETGIFGGGGLLGLGSETRDLIPLFNLLGIEYEEFLDLLAAPTGPDSLRQLKDRYLELSLAAQDAGNEELADQYQAQAEAARDAADGLDDYQNSVAGATVGQEELDIFLGRSSDALTRLNEDLAALRDPMETMPELWNALIQDAKDGTFEWENAATAIDQLVEATGLSRDAILERIYSGAEDALRDEAAAAGEAAGKWDLLTGAIDKSNTLVDDAVGKWEQMTGAIDKSNTLIDETAGKYDIVTGAIDKSNTLIEDSAGKFDIATGAIDKSAAATQGLSDELADVVGSLDAAAGRAEAFAGALQDINDNSELTGAQETIGFAESLGALGDALEKLGDFDGDLVPDTWAEVLNMPEELGPVVDALSNFRSVMQSEFTQAFEQGGATEARQWAADTRQAIIDELRGTGQEGRTREILESLGLTDTQIDYTIRVAVEEQARGVIDSLQGIIEDLPTEVQLKIVALAATDPVAAVQLIIDSLEAQGIEVPVELTILADQLQGDVDAAAASTDPPIVQVVAQLVPDPNAKTFGGDLASELDPVDVKTELESTATEDALVALVEPRTATVTAELAGAQSVESGINLVARERDATVNVVTGDISLPSAATLANNIGTVYVKVQGVWANRVEGSRPHG